MAQKFTVPVTIKNLSSAGSDGITVFLDQESYARLKVEAGGRFTWGDGTGAGDTNLYRDDSSVLKTDDTFKSAGLYVAGTQIDPSGATLGDALVFNGTKFVSASVAGGGATLTVSDSAPTSGMVEGDLWFESDTGKTFVYYDSFWVEIGNSGGGVVADNISGNAATATALETARTISLSGDVSGSVSFNGTADASITATIQPNSVALGTDTTGNYMSDLTQGTGVTITHTPSEGSNATISIGQAVGTSSSVQFAGIRNTNFSNFGSNTFTKATVGAGEIAIDNGTTDTPGLLMYHANNNNWGIDSSQINGSQSLRFVTNLNETGGTVRASIDASGNMVATTFRGTAAGSVLKDTMLDNSEVTVVSTTAGATGSMVNFITYSYTPVSSSSYLIVNIHISKYTMAGTTDDSWYSQINVDGSEIAYGWQKVNDDGQGTSGRSGVLFPLTGRYTNSNTTAKTIGIAARRDSADDSITIDNSSTAIWLRITEVAR